jgi:hypothetical protein
MTRSQWIRAPLGLIHPAHRFSAVGNANIGSATIAGPARRVRSQSCFGRRMRLASLHLRRYNYSDADLWRDLVWTTEKENDAPVQATGRRSMFQLRDLTARPCLSICSELRLTRRDDGEPLRPSPIRFASIIRRRNFFAHSIVLAGTKKDRPGRISSVHRCVVRVKNDTPASLLGRR